MGFDAMVSPFRSDEELASNARVCRTTSPLEASHSCHRRWLAGGWLVLLRSARLGHTDKHHHGADGVPDSIVVDARHGGEVVAAVALDAFLDVVHCRWVLLAVLEFQEPCCP